MNLNPRLRALNFLPVQVKRLGIKPMQWIRPSYCMIRSETVIRWPESMQFIYQTDHCTLDDVPLCYTYLEETVEYLGISNVINRTEFISSLFGHVFRKMVKCDERQYGSVAIVNILNFIVVFTDECWWNLHFCFAMTIHVRWKTKLEWNCWSMCCRECVPTTLALFLGHAHLIGIFNGDAIVTCLSVRLSTWNLDLNFH